MPVWLQLTAALTSALVSGIMGIALIPFLQKCRFCTPESEQAESETISGNRLKPTMGGLLLLFGWIAGLVLGNTLYLRSGIADRTGTAFQTESHTLWLMLGYALFFGVSGWITDYLIIKRKLYYRISEKLLLLAVFLTSCAFLKFLPEENILDFGFFQWNAGILSIPVRALLLSLFWYSMQKPEQNTDGIGITVSAVQLLFLAILLLSEKQNLYALYALTAAGACMGCFYWNLYPAKCRLGQTGTYWLGAVVSMLCMHCQDLTVLLLFIAVWLINILPVLFRKKTLLDLLKEEGKSPLNRIITLTGFALFCSILSIISIHT